MQITTLKAEMLLSIILAVLLTCCGTGLKHQSETEQSETTAYKFDLQGHRGCRGLFPENSIAAFKKALELGVNTMELDLAVSKDSLLVVSHEPWFSASICTDSLGNDISEEEEKAYNIHQHTYEEVARYDCGSKGNPRFPEQNKMKQTKPLLDSAITFIESYIKENNLPEVDYNIEIKSDEAGDNLYHPSPAVYSDLVYNFLEQTGIAPERITIQSFDLRVLKYWNEHYASKYKNAFLVANKNTFEENIAELGFKPAIYSPAYQMLDSTSVNEIHSASMLAIPWTVNEQAEMQKLLTWGVDGIITDYPDRALVFK
ncbi:glycerophosphodiester phosphodiesterase family protein [Chondrinema litorale]|uniref:glycerophosphodiester phosphodiesterase family protein n=1 Tax=Chondrinema litorale TaxID=2994555 RepID=UPI0025432B77|nr:glycerophosphodiester phosphodiesterase family protein [Chondrinema litorale]UZR95181.1 glycerophosphodiester phosphodiesterase family protein [Chondrinema litorale]